MDDTVAGLDVDGNDVGAVDGHTVFAGDEFDLFALQGGHSAGSDVGRRHLSTEDVVREHCDKRSFVLRQQQCVDEAGGQCSECVIGRSEDGERTFARQRLGEPSGGDRSDEGVKRASSDSDVDDRADFGCFGGFSFGGGDVSVVAVAAASRECQNTGDEAGCKASSGGALHWGDSLREMNAVVHAACATLISLRRPASPG